MFSTPSLKMAKRLTRLTMPFLSTNLTNFTRNFTLKPQIVTLAFSQDFIVTTKRDGLLGPKNLGSLFQTGDN